MLLFYLLYLSLIAIISYFRRFKKQDNLTKTILIYLKGLPQSMTSTLTFSSNVRS